MDREKVLMSPTRNSLFRACKSPPKEIKLNREGIKPLGEDIKTSREEIKRRLLESKKKKIKRWNSRDKREDKNLALDLLEKFPIIRNNFEITRKVGEGTFSKVYLAHFHRDPSEMVALKYLVPTSSPGRIENELNCLQTLGGVHNVLAVKSVLRKDDHTVFILPYFPHSKFACGLSEEEKDDELLEVTSKFGDNELAIDFMREMTVNDIRSYMYHLFVALKHVHCQQIIHRDVKPSNFLYCKQQQRYSLIDFGLAMPVPGSKTSLLTDYTTKGSLRSFRSAVGSKSTYPNNCKHPPNHFCTLCKARPRQSAPRAGTPGFRSPEVLFRYPHQTTAVDMWSAGVILLCILSGRYPFFKARDDAEALSQLIVLFGTERFTVMANEIGKDFIASPVVDNVDDLRTLCEKLSQRGCFVHHNIPDNRRSKRKRKNREAEARATNSKRPVDNQLLSMKEEKIPAESKNNDNSFSMNKDSFTLESSIDTTADLQCDTNSEICTCLPDSAYNLLEKLLELNPHKRITAEEALNHSFIVTR